MVCDSMPPPREKPQTALHCTLLVACRYNSFAAPVIHAVKALLPDCTSHINAPGEDQDYVLMLEDVERLEPNVVEPITMWLEQQLAHMIQVASGLVVSTILVTLHADSQHLHLAQVQSLSGVVSRSMLLCYNCALVRVPC